MYSNKFIRSNTILHQIQKFIQPIAHLSDDENIMKFNDISGYNNGYSNHLFHDNLSCVLKTVDQSIHELQTFQKKLLL